MAENIFVDTELIGRYISNLTTNNVVSSSFGNASDDEQTTILANAKGRSAFGGANSNGASYESIFSGFLSGVDNLKNEHIEFDDSIGKKSKG